MVSLSFFSIFNIVNSLEYRMFYNRLYHKILRLHCYVRWLTRGHYFAEVESHVGSPISPLHPEETNQSVRVDFWKRKRGSFCRYSNYRHKWINVEKVCIFFCFCCVSIYTYTVILKRSLVRASSHQSMHQLCNQ